MNSVSLLLSQTTKYHFYNRCVYCVLCVVYCVLCVLCFGGELMLVVMHNFRFAESFQKELDVCVPGPYIAYMD